MTRAVPVTERAVPRTYAFRIGYLAEGFFGYSRQPGLRTVEGVLREGLRRRGVLGPSEERQFRTASRTDRGVHALGNVVSFPTRLPGARAARVLGDLDPSIFCTGWAEVPAEFQPRHATERWYRYLEPIEGHDLETWRRGARLFAGEHEFLSFSRRDEPPRPTRVTISSCEVTALEGCLCVDLRAPHFLWNQVRKIVAALGGLERKILSVREIERALEGSQRLSLPLAPPEGLLLMEVSYPFPFNDEGLPTRRSRDRLEALLQQSRRRRGVLGQLQARHKTDQPPG